MNNLLRKLTTAGRVVSSVAVWRVVAAETWRSARAGAARGDGGNGSGPGPVITAVGDADGGLRLIDVSGRRFWEPETMDIGGLAEIHEEVFRADHPHYYEYRECMVRPGDVVVDAGASEGFFTRFALERGARVIAVEPWSVQAGALRRTFRDEIAAGLVAVEQVALSDAEGEVTLEVDPRSPWGGTVGSAYNGSVRETVAATTLDRLVERTWGRCDFLKADVEGAEVRLVAGARQTLARDRPRVAIAVYHGPTNYLDIRAALRSLRAGYHVTGKGLQRRRFLLIPKMLHAWPAVT